MELINAIEPQIFQIFFLVASDIISIKGLYTARILDEGWDKESERFKICRTIRTFFLTFNM
jgi:hypothetical protein